MKKVLFLSLVFLFFAFTQTFGAATDKFETYRSGLTSPGYSFFAITPSDTNELAYVTRGIYVGGDGDVVAKGADGIDVNFIGVKQGLVYPFRVKMIYNSTTATSLVGAY